MSWRLAQRDAPIPSHHLAQMQTLAQEDDHRLWKLIVDLGIHDEFPFKKGAFSSVASLALKPVDHQDDLEAEIPIVVCARCAVSSACLSLVSSGYGLGDDLEEVDQILELVLLLDCR